MTRVVLFIPARYASKRFPGKALYPLKGATGRCKTLVHRTWDAGSGVEGITERHVLTDDARIMAEVDGFGGSAILTPKSCANGTERCAKGYAALAKNFGTVVNLQGDAPLTPPHFITALIDAMQADKSIQVATPVIQLTSAQKKAFHEQRLKGTVGGTTVTVGRDGNALYFSKEVIPHGGALPLYHVGVYAYRPSALRKYSELPETKLEASEGLEQLRFLELGIPVRCVRVSPPEWDVVEVNNLPDIVAVQSVMQQIDMA